MRKRKVFIAGAVVAVAALIPGIALASGSGDDDGTDVPITGPALEQASAAALDFVGEGSVTETEVGDEESYYEVEVTLSNGSQIDVQLDEAFNVVGSEAEGAGDD